MEVTRHCLYVTHIFFISLPFLTKNDLLSLHQNKQLTGHRIVVDILFFIAWLLYRLLLSMTEMTMRYLYQEFRFYEFR